MIIFRFRIDNFILKLLYEPKSKYLYMIVSYNVLRWFILYSEQDEKCVGFKMMYYLKIELANNSNSQYFVL